MTVNEILEAINPGLYSDVNRDTYIELATNQTDRCFFGVNYNMAIALRASHMYILANRPNGETGQISSKKEGDLSVGFSTSKSSGASDDLSQTNHGMQLLTLIKQGLPAVSVTNDNIVNATCVGGC